MGLVYHCCRPGIRTACLSGSITSSLTLTTCPGWPGSGRRAPGPKVLCAREGEIVTGTRENAAVGLGLMPVTDPKTVNNRLHLDQASRAVLGRPGQPQGKPVLRDTPKGNDHPGKARAR